MTDTTHTNTNTHAHKRTHTHTRPQTLKDVDGDLNWMGYTPDVTGQWERVRSLEAPTMTADEVRRPNPRVTGKSHSPSSPPSALPL